MSDTRIILGLPDYRRLSGVVAAIKEKRRPMELHMKKLAQELETANIIEGDELPENAVAIGSVIQLLDMENGETFETKLVFPAELDGTQATTSVLSPIGAAMIGERTGKIISCVTPSGEKRFKLEGVLLSAENQ